MGGGESEDLPLANVKRVVKTKLQELTLAHYGEERDVAINKDALLAFSESAKIFIHFLSATYALSFSSFTTPHTFVLMLSSWKLNRGCSQEEEFACFQ